MYKAKFDKYKLIHESFNNSNNDEKEEMENEIAKNEDYYSTKIAQKEDLFKNIRNETEILLLEENLRNNIYKQIIDLLS